MVKMFNFTKSVNARSALYCEINLSCLIPLFALSSSVDCCQEVVYFESLMYCTFEKITVVSVTLMLKHLYFVQKL